MKYKFIATLITVMCIAIISCGTPKQRYNKLIRKYPYLVETDTVIVKDTIIKETKVPVPEFKDSFIITHDTIIETEKLIIERRGDFFGITVKPDTLTFRDTIPYEVKVPGRIAYIEKINWWYVVISFIIGLCIAVYLRR
jgi:hypothetical protein